MNQLTVVPGSLLDAAQRNNTSLAESFLSCDALVIVDSSASMTNRDASSDRTRHQAARDELRQLQSSLPGRVGVIEMAPFSWDEATRTTGRGSFTTITASEWLVK